MNKQSLIALGNSLLAEHLPSDWKFELNKRKSSLGLCSFTKKTIYSSEYFIGRIDDNELKDTILHEIAHALADINDDHRGHGSPWKKACRSIGAKPVRCHTGEVVDDEGKYLVKCPSCSFKFARHRFNRTKLTQLKNGFSWFNCTCKTNRMDVYFGGKKIVDGNSSKRPAPATKKQVEAMSTKELIAHMRKNGLINSKA